MEAPNSRFSTIYTGANFVWLHVKVLPCANPVVIAMIRHSTQGSPVSAVRAFPAIRLERWSFQEVLVSQRRSLRLDRQLCAGCTHSKLLSEELLHLYHQRDAMGTYIMCESCTSTTWVDRQTASGVAPRLLTISFIFVSHTYFALAAVRRESGFLHLGSNPAS